MVSAYFFEEGLFLILSSTLVLILLTAVTNS
jgi:hypothetical protein